MFDKGLRSRHALLTDLTNLSVVIVVYESSHMRTCRYICPSESYTDSILGFNNTRRHCTRRSHWIAVAIYLIFTNLIRSLFFLISMHISRDTRHTRTVKGQRMSTIGTRWRRLRHDRSSTWRACQERSSTSSINSRQPLSPSSGACCLI